MNTGRNECREKREERQTEDMGQALNTMGTDPVINGKWLWRNTTAVGQFVQLLNLALAKAARHFMRGERKDVDMPVQEAKLFPL